MNLKILWMVELEDDFIENIDFFYENFILKIIITIKM